MKKQWLEGNFVNKNPSIRIIDFLKILDPKRKIELIGLRPGEKINETLITNEELDLPMISENIIKLFPQYFQNRKKINKKF